MFNATGGYLNDPYQAHWSVVSMYCHIQNSDRHLAHKICLFPQHESRNSYLNFATSIKLSHKGICH